MIKYSFLPVLLTLCCIHTVSYSVPTSHALSIIQSFYSHYITRHTPQLMGTPPVHTGQKTKSAILQTLKINRSHKKQGLLGLCMLFVVHQLFKKKSLPVHTWTADPFGIQATFSKLFLFETSPEIASTSSINTKNSSSTDNLVTLASFILSLVF